MCDNLSVHDFKILVVGIATVMHQPVFVHHIFHTQNGFISQPVVIHHKSVSGVKGINLKRSVIFLTRFIRQNHSEGSSADMKPVSQLLILCRLFFCKNKLVKLIDCFCQIITVTTGDIL